MLKGYLLRVIIAAISFFLTTAAVAFNDGFTLHKKIESKHFIIQIAPNVEIPVLIQQLNISLSDKIMVGKPIGGKTTPEAELIDMLDTLFMRVCDILDMQLYSFQGNIKVCRDRAQLNEIYRTLFNKELTAQSFYVNDPNTIYISLDSFKREILGHEIGHAIISHYFVVLPSVKIQELLATYVEYQLRKTGQ